MPHRLLTQFGMKKLSGSSLQIGSVCLKALQIAVLTGTVVLSTGCISFGDDGSWVGQRAKYYEKRGVSPAEARHAAEWDHHAETGRFAD